jgi:glycosidase
MKRNIILSLIALFCCASMMAQQNQGAAKKQYMVYGVAFYNLENLFDTINNNGSYDLEYSPNGARQWDGRKYWIKINNLARAIAAMTTQTTPNGPALIGVSEVENRSVLEDLVKAVDNQLRAAGKQPWNLQIVHHDSPDRRGVDVSCLYNPRQFRFLNVSNSLLTIPGRPEFRSRDQMCVTGILGGDTLSVIVNHWPSRLGGQEQSSYLREHAAALSKHIADSLWTLRPNQGVIVMGDLNDDPNNKSCSVALGAQKKMDKVGPHGFYNPFWSILDKGIGTLAYKGQWNLFDQIIVSGTLLEQNDADLYFKSAKVNNFEFLRGTDGTRQNYPQRTFSAGVFYENGYSDHYPTEIFLVKERKPGQRQAAATAQATPARTTVSHADWSRNAVIYEINWRQMTSTGKLPELANELPRLKELGVDIIWMMPIHPISELNRKGGLGSYYAVRDYKDVNPELGTLDQFKDFVKKAHEIGLKVIIDWVPNHSGCDNAWVSEHPEWYARNEKGEMFGPFDWTDVYKFDYSNPQMRAAMIDALKFWLTDANIDGFRCDVAMQVPTDFWNEARPQLQAVKPDLFMLAEAADADLVEHAFDMDYNWPMKDVFNNIAATAGQRTFDDKTPEQPANALAIDARLAQEAQTYAADSYLMNMVTNHDLNSWEGTEFQRLGNLTNAFAVLTFTLPGMPLIYTGQETGMNRAFEFFIKDVPPTFTPRNEYFTFYQRLAALKHSQAALAAGDKGGKVVRYATSSPDIYVFSRSVNGSNVLVITNLGKDTQQVKYTAAAPDATVYTYDWMAQADAAQPTTLAPGEYRIFVSK